MNWHKLLDARKNKNSYRLDTYRINEIANKLTVLTLSKSCSCEV